MLSFTEGLKNPYAWKARLRSQSIKILVLPSLVKERRSLVRSHLGCPRNRVGCGGQPEACCRGALPCCWGEVTVKLQWSEQLGLGARADWVLDVADYSINSNGEVSYLCRIFILKFCCFGKQEWKSGCPACRIGVVALSSTPGPLLWRKTKEQWTPVFATQI